MAVGVRAFSGLRAARRDGGNAAGAARHRRPAEFAQAASSEVAEQRQLIIQMMQMEQQRYDMLLQAASVGRRCRRRRALPPPARRPSSARRRLGAERPAAAVAGTHQRRREQRRAPRSRDGGTVTVDHAQAARSRTSTSTSTGEGCAGARGHTLEIKQKDKQFSPQVAVGPARHDGGVPQLGHRLSQRVLDVAGATASTSAATGRATSRRSVGADHARASSRCSATSTRRCAPNVLVVPNATVREGRAPTAPSASRTCRSGTPQDRGLEPGAKPVPQKVDVAPTGGQVDVQPRSRGGDGPH